MSKNFWLNKEVLVLGASGFLGSHMVDLLVEKGAKVSAQISKNSKKNNLFNSIEKIRLISGDLLDQKFCIEILEGNDVVLNFAAVDGGGDYKKMHSAEILRINTTICLNILEAARINRVKKLLLVSSITVEPAYLGLDKKSTNIILRRDIDGYSLSKIFLENAARIYTAQYGLDTIIIRPGNIYGPRDNLDKRRVVTTFIQQALSNKQISLIGSGNLELALIHVEDFVRASVTALEKSKNDTPINIIGSKAITLKELALLIIKLTKSKSKLKSSITKINSVKPEVHSSFNFREKYSLEEGIRQTVEHMNKNLK